MNSTVKNNYLKTHIFAVILSITVFYSYAFSQNENYPIPPKTQERLFYIQRNHNANTIVYDANFDKNGNLDENKPIDVYWIRYDEQGQKMELRSIEKWYAYGVDCEKSDNKSFFNVELAADKKRAFYLHQIGKFRARLTTLISGKTSILDHMYIFADNSGVWPTVKYIELFGNDLKTGVKTYQKIIVDKDGI
jgi:hypothetical protein